MSKRISKKSEAAVGQTPVSQTPVGPNPVANPLVAAFMAWLFPGLGHLYLKQTRRGAAFSGLVLLALVLGILLHGKASWDLLGPTLSALATLGCAGSGLPYLAFAGLGYRGDPTAVFFEHGGALILTAGLMNLLLVLDVWDHATGRLTMAALDRVE
jgi:hypothetical protein